MQDFSNYSYTIQIDDLKETVIKAMKGGYPVFVVINGEYYDVDIDGSKLKNWKEHRERK